MASKLPTVQDVTNVIGLLTLVAKGVKSIIRIFRKKDKQAEKIQVVATD